MLPDPDDFVLTGADRKVTLKGNGHTISGVNSIFTMKGAELNLGTSDGSSGTLTIRGVTNNDNPGIIYIDGIGSKANMYDGTTLADHTGNNYYGGGVTIQQGIFHMYGGTIENCGIQGGSVCYGGGVAAYKGAQFIMDGGAIKNCFAKTSYTGGSWSTPPAAGGGVWVFGGASFVMNGGTIENCVAESGGTTNPTGFGGGVAATTSSNAYYANSGYGYLDAALILNGGTITGNSANMAAGGVGAGLRYIMLPPLAATEVDAAANPNPYGVTINGTEISNNTATSGGGLFLFWIRKPVTISNATIASNKAEEGGGALIQGYWTQATFDGCSITDNTASNGAGGGLLLYGNTSSSGTTLTNTTVTGNSSSVVGGGIFASSSDLTFGDGSAIYDNEAGTRDPNSGGADDFYSDAASTINNLPAMQGLYGGVKYQGWYWDYDEADVDDGATFEYPAGTTNPKLRYAKETGVVYTPIAQEKALRYLKVVAAPKFVIHFNQNTTDQTANMPDSVEVYEGESLPEPSEPTREGYKFLGWFTSADGNDLYDFSSAVTTDTTLYARWASIEPTSTEPTSTPSQPTTDTPGTVTPGGDDNNSNSGGNSSEDSSGDKQPSDAQEETILPQTGDDARLAVLITLIVSSGVLAVVAYRKMRSPEVARFKR